jgi:hypothetical protein
VQLPLGCMPLAVCVHSTSDSEMLTCRGVTFVNFICHYITRILTQSKLGNWRYWNRHFVLIFQPSNNVTKLLNFVVSHSITEQTFTWETCALLGFYAAETVVCYRRFGTTYLVHLIGCPETSVKFQKSSDLIYTSAKPETTLKLFLSVKYEQSLK